MWTQDRGWRFLIQRRLPGLTGGWNPKRKLLSAPRRPSSPSALSRPRARPGPTSRERAGGRGWRGDARARPRAGGRGGRARCPAWRTAVSESAVGGCGNAERPCGSRAPGLRSSEVTRDGPGAREVSAGPGHEWRRPPAWALTPLLPRRRGRGAGPGSRRLLSARRGRCALSRRACHPAPAPAAQASGARRRALPPLFCLDLGRRGSSSLVVCVPPPRVVARMRRRAARRPIGCGLAHAPRSSARLPPRPPLSLFSTISKPVRKMLAVVTGCGGPAPPGSPPPPRSRPPLRSSQW